MLISINLFWARTATSTSPILQPIHSWDNFSQNVWVWGSAFVEARNPSSPLHWWLVSKRGFGQSGTTNCEPLLISMASCQLPRAEFGFWSERSSLIYSYSVSARTYLPLDYLQALMEFMILIKRCPTERKDTMSPWSCGLMHICDVAYFT